MMRPSEFLPTTAVMLPPGSALTVSAHVVLRIAALCERKGLGFRLVQARP